MLCRAIPVGRLRTSDPTYFEPITMSQVNESGEVAIWRNGQTVNTRSVVLTEQLRTSFIGDQSSFSALDGVGNMWRFDGSYSVVLAALNRSTLQLNRLKYNKLRTSYFSTYSTGRGNHMYYVDSSGSMWTGTGGVNNGYADNPYSVVLNRIQQG